MTDEWVGTHHVRPDLPPYIVERRPYEKCPRCKEFEYRAVYDGRTEECVKACKNCRREDTCRLEPDRYVHDANKAAGDVTLVVLALGALALLIWLLWEGLAVVL